MAELSSDQMWLTGGIAVYMAIMLYIGWWTSKKIQNTSDFIVAGSRLGWWLSIGSLFATWFGGETCMGSSTTAFNKGILGVISDPFGAGLCLILAGFFFIKVFRRLKIETIIDYFEHRYGKRVSQLFSILYLPVYLGWVGGQFMGLGLILHTLVGLPEMPAMIVGTLVVLFYTYYGGMWAVSVTDFVQMFFIVLGLVALYPILVDDLGGFTAIHAQIPENFFHFYPREGGVLTWMNYAQAWAMVAIGSLPAQDLFQRIMSPKNAKIAAGSAIISGVMYIVIGLIPVLIGIYGRIAFPESDGESILIDVANKYLPLPLKALMISALISAIMSTACSALLAPASIIGKNIVPMFIPHITEEAKLKWCRYSILILCAASLTLALQFESAYELCTNSWGVLLVGIAAPMIFGVFWKKANRLGAYAGAVAGLTVWIALLNSKGNDDFPSNLVAFFANAIVLVIVSLATQRHHSSPQVAPQQSVAV